ncbi:hypothetical protein [Clostridium intestinale]|uniref:hypothetical protein n=1 Tax=Clostridium intestinale TaxID=36845 RepID=UPI002DD64913|nr:hypothetical protein [Clostridium intestinale]WRY51420.1 hypothetical protein P8F83_22660 [Clostridium intestinale]
MAEKVKLSAHEVDEILKEDDEKGSINIEWTDEEEIDGEVVNELISSRYEEVTSNSKKETVLINKEEKDFEVRKIKRGKRKTPTIDGEEFDVKRTYMMRKSTVRMLNQLKGMSEDVDIHMSTILDIVIRHYFNSVIEDGKNEVYLGKKQ